MARAAMCIFATSVSCWNRSQVSGFGTAVVNDNPSYGASSHCLNWYKCTESDINLSVNANGLMKK